MKPIEINFANIRFERQKINNLLAFDSIIKKDLTKNINIKEFERILDELDITKNELLDKCLIDDITAKILSGRIAINASRQGSKDEDMQLTTCNITTSKFGIKIEKLSATALRPTKFGKILKNDEVKTKKIQSNDCLKSFDGKISGKVNGFITAKVVYGEGGHQDNVFEEAHTFCEWVKKYGDKTDLFVVMIDTNLIDKFNELKKKYNKISNIFIGNHITIQQYFIDNYNK